jgi:transcriptional regulator with XRE-family HTH domain
MSSGVIEDIVWSPRLGAHLEASRLRSGLRRLDLASRLGVSEETIRLWEKGAVQPSAERLATLIAVLSLESSLWHGAAEADPDPDLPPLALRLREERDARGLTQASVAYDLGVRQATYAGWETGRSTPAAEVFPRLASYLGLAERDVAKLCGLAFVVDYSSWPPFGQLVGARRQELLLSRSALAQAVGVSESTVVAWELGYRIPGPAHLSALAETLSVHVARLTEFLPVRWNATGLGELILRRQQELGLRSVDVARRMGTTEATVSRWVRGRSRPLERNLELLADVLDVPYDDVLEVAGRQP